MHKNEQTQGPVDLPGYETLVYTTSKAVDETALTAQAMSLGLTPVRAFVRFAGTSPSNDLAHLNKPLVQKKSNATRTACARSTWRGKGFNQLVLVVPDSEDIRGAFRAIESELKRGASWSNALYHDQAVANVVSANEDLLRKLSLSRDLLEKTQQELAAAELLAERRSLLGITRVGLSSFRAIVDSVFGHRQYEAK